MNGIVGEGTATGRWTAEVTDPVTGEVTVLVAGSEAGLEAKVGALLEERYPTPVDPGAGGQAGAAAVRQLMKQVTALVGSSTRLVEVSNVDGRLVRIEIGVGASPRMGDLQVIAQLEPRLENVLEGRWQACWHLDAGTLLITPFCTMFDQRRGSVLNGGIVMVPRYVRNPVEG